MPAKASAAKAFIDTNVLLYALAPDDSRSFRAEAILAESPTLSVQVLNECVNVLRRKLLWNWSRIDAALTAVHQLCGAPLPLTYDIHRSAVGIAKRYDLHIYDSLILGSALGAGCTVLYSEDMQAGQRIGSLTILNPFRPR